MLYEYTCPICDNSQTLAFDLGTAPEKIEQECKRCGLSRVLRRVYGIAGLLFKGRGFYTTDSRKFVDVDTSKVPKHMLDR